MNSDRLSSLPPVRESTSNRLSPHNEPPVVASTRPLPNSSINSLLSPVAAATFPPLEPPRIDELRVQDTELPDAELVDENYDDSNVRQTSGQPPMITTRNWTAETESSRNYSDGQFSVANSASDISALPPVITAPTTSANPASVTQPKKRSWLSTLLRFPFYLAARSLDVLSLLVFLAVLSAIPIVQFVSLGYLLMAGSRLAQQRPWRQCLPGHRLAGKLGVFVLIASLLFLPVLFVDDLAETAKVLEPGSPMAARWQLGALAITVAWLVHIGWAALRGGRWWHLIWPAPFKFLARVWRPSTWSKASDSLYEFVDSLQLPKLWWLGARATVGALLWLVIPVSMMIIGQRAPAGIAPLIGLIGSLLMAWVMFYLPFLQMLFAKTGSMSSFLAVQQVRQNYRFAPWAHLFALLLLSALAIPLYLLRIENPPAELMWAPSLIFALLMLPTKLVLGWAVGYAEMRQERQLKRRSWWVRYPANVLALVPVGIYVGALFVAQLIAGQGAYVMYFQHAFLVPNPLSNW